MKRFKQVMFNLLGNAIKFTFKGSVTVTLDFDDKNENLTCIVKDTGIGIDEEGVKSLFQFFTCLSKSRSFNRSGMGLGLTISKMIIQELGGNISVASNPGIGSSFIINLPLEQYESQLNSRKTIGGKNFRFDCQD